MTMTDFDKLIKEKVEEATYPYDASAWKQFQKKSGMRSGTLKYWLAGASTALVAGGVAVFMLTRPVVENTKQPSELQILHDTASQVVTMPQGCQQEDIVTVESRKCETKSLRTVSQECNPEPQQMQASETVIKTPKPSTTNEVRYGRPLVIDVDTIKDNIPSDEELKNGHSRLF
jgi:hypothetical protein